MAINTYSGLKNAIGVWLSREDLSAYIPDFVTFAEGFINDNVRHRKMLEIASLTPVNGVCPLPTDYLQYRRVVLDTGTRYVLQYITPDQADARYPSSPGGLSQHFTIVGTDLLMFPTTDTDIELTYWQKIPALSDSNTSNWLLDERPEAYLRLGCAFAAEFTKNDAEAQKQMALAMQIFGQIEGQDTLANYSRAGMTSNEVRP